MLCWHKKDITRRLNNILFLTNCTDEYFTLEVQPYLINRTKGKMSEHDICTDDTALFHFPEDFRQKLHPFPDRQREHLLRFPFGDAVGAALEVLSYDCFLPVDLFLYRDCSARHCHSLLSP